MAWLARRIDAWASGRQQKEVSDYVARLRSMDGAEIGMVVAMATHFRHLFAAQGHDVMDPMLSTTINPALPSFVAKLIRQAQQAQQLPQAGALMVWLHTLRGAVRLELRQSARDMWRELARGFPHVDDARYNLLEITGRLTDVDGADQFPKGFTPDPLWRRVTVGRSRTAQPQRARRVRPRSTLSYNHRSARCLPRLRRRPHHPALRRRSRRSVEHAVAGDR